MHVVCCPPPDADPALLWQRFAGVVGFDPEPRSRPPDRTARTPRWAPTEIDLLRRVNVALDKRLVQPDYGRVVKQLYAQELLGRRPVPRPVVPPEMYDDLVVVGERWVKEIDKAGYDVHGDLAALVPVAARGAGAAPRRRRPAASQVDVRRRRDRRAAAGGAARPASEVARLEADNARLRRKRKLLKRRLSAATDGLRLDIGR